MIAKGFAKLIGLLMKKNVLFGQRLPNILKCVCHTGSAAELVKFRGKTGLDYASIFQPGRWMSPAPGKVAWNWPFASRAG